MKKSSKAQSIIEYTTVILLVAAGIILIRPYVIRGINAHMKTWEDSVGDSLNDPLKHSNQTLASLCGDNICDGSENYVNCCRDCGSCGDGICCHEKNEDRIVIIGGIQRVECPQDCGFCGDRYCCNDHRTPICYEDTDPTKCCSDCPQGQAPVCDGICCRLNGNPDPNECPQDCNPVDPCGDGVCDPLTENKTNCCVDCAFCGDTQCDTGGCTYGTHVYRETRNVNDSPCPVGLPHPADQSCYCPCDCHCGNGRCEDGVQYPVPTGCTPPAVAESAANCPGDCTPCMGCSGLCNCLNLGEEECNNWNDFSCLPQAGMCTGGCQCSDYYNQGACNLANRLGCSWRPLACNNSNCRVFQDPTTCCANGCFWHEVFITDINNACVLRRDRLCIGLSPCVEFDVSFCSPVLFGACNNGCVGVDYSGAACNANPPCPT